MGGTDREGRRGGGGEGIVKEAAKILAILMEGHNIRGAYRKPSTPAHQHDNALHLSYWCAGGGVVSAPAADFMADEPSSQFF